MPIDDLAVVMNRSPAFHPRSKNWRIFDGMIVASVFTIIFPVGSIAQIAETGFHNGVDEKGTRRIVSLVRTDLPPQIDGRLDDPSWLKAPVISNFTQVRPNEGHAPTEKTEIRLLYDANFIYIGVRAFDSEPDKIVAHLMQRDISLRSEDRIRLTFDTFLSRRNGYYFAINPRGSRRDGLVDPNAGRGGYQAEWDGIWYGKSRIDEEGWTAEIAIPAKTLNFNPAINTWGFNVERDIQRKNEKLRWAAPFRNKRVTTMNDAGLLKNIHGLKQGKGIDFIPFANFRYKHNRVTGTNISDLKAGFDFFYKITPAITAAFTLNTDFAEAEVDARRVNLTRFPLFFAEKRVFFLQDATIFQFAGINRSPLPFFSRRIGLNEDREEVDIITGVKITGRAGRVNFGLLNVQVDKSENLDSKNLSVARATISLFGESYMGIIATYGDPTTNDENLLYGFDFNYRNSDFKGTGQIVESRFYLMQTDSTGLSGDDYAFGAEFEYPNDKWRFGVKFKEIGENFNPAMGFVSQTGTRQYLSWLRRTWHPENLVEFYINGFGRVRTRLDGSVLDREIWIPKFGFETLNQDEAFVVPIFYQEQLFEPFEIIDGVFIPSGNYHFNRFRAEINFSEARKISGALEVEFGDFFNGERTEIVAQVGWRPSPHFNFNAQYETNIVTLPQDEFTIRIVQVDFNIQFTPDLVWNTTTQWDNESNEFGLNSRIRWTIKPGQDFFFIFNQGVDTSDNRWHPTETEFSTKLAWTFRY